MTTPDRHPIFEGRKGQEFFDHLNDIFSILSRMEEAGDNLSQEDCVQFLKIQKALHPIEVDGTGRLLDDTRMMASSFPDRNRYLGSEPGRNYVTATHSHMARGGDYSSDGYKQFFMQMRRMISEIARTVARKQDSVDQSVSQD